MGAKADVVNQVGTKGHGPFLVHLLEEAMRSVKVVVTAQQSENNKKTKPGIAQLREVFPTGIEPALPVPETGALSTELREHHDDDTTNVKYPQALQTLSFITMH